MTSAKTYPPLTAYRIHRSDGTSYVTSMAAGITLADAKNYFLGQTFTDECLMTGRETKWRCVDVTEYVEPAKPASDETRD